MMNNLQKKFLVMIGAVIYGFMVLGFSIFYGLFEAFRVVTTALVATALITGAIIGFIYLCFWVEEKYHELGKVSE